MHSFLCLDNMQNADYHGYIVLSLSVRITLSARTFLFYSIILQNANFVQFLIIILYPVYFYPLYPKTLLHIPVCTENQKGIFTA